MSAYYNEHAPFAAEWLRGLIKKGLIAPGIVDERSIEDVKPEELRGFVQCHFFAGIGVWSAALRGAGWPDDRPVWTGSCPCQPFSTAGKGAGFADKRHLWPAWLHLIKHGKSPEVPVFGEQVASDDGLTWLDTVRSDMEGEGYEVRAVDLCSAGVGAPHIRQRLFFVASRADGVTQGDIIGSGLEGLGGNEYDRDEPGWIGAGKIGSIAAAGDTGGMADAGCVDSAGRGDVGDVGDQTPGDQGTCEERERLRNAAHNSGADDRMADSGHDQRGGRNSLRDADGEYGSPTSQGEGAGSERERPEHDTPVRSAGDGVADANSEGGCGRGIQRPGESDGQSLGPTRERPTGLCAVGSMAEPDSERFNEAAFQGIHHPEYHIEPRSDVGDKRPGPTNGFWSVVDWLFCKDEKWRPVESGTQPLADGTAQVVGRMQPRLEAVGVDPATIARVLGRRNSVLAIAARNRIVRLKGYGNAINRRVAEAFIRAWMEC